ncbi:hypothetical protein BD779DRAFT_1710347 [Infundibulicybe gibba]|nr:hypothetical protein BD779DRAFT_1710347 [Infundibulicybe gibba]
MCLAKFGRPMSYDTTLQPRSKFVHDRPDLGGVGSHNGSRIPGTSVKFADPIILTGWDPRSSFKLTTTTTYASAPSERRWDENARRPQICSCKRREAATKAPGHEILAEIFLHCLPPDKWGSLSAGDAPWLLVKVCRKWREVALSTPELWSRFPFLYTHPRRGQQLFKFYFEYSAMSPLSIGFELPQHRDNALSLPLITSGK